VLLAAGVGLALLALLHPVFGGEEATMERRGADVVVCLDVSRSMLARDLEPDRLARAKAEVRALAERARGDRMALVLFAGEARVAVPLTRDLRAVADLADLATPEDVLRGGTDLGAALDAALGALAERGAEARAILLLTDGEDHGDGGLRAAHEARRRGVVVHGLGFGTARGSKVVVEGPAGETFLRDRQGVDVVSALDAGGLQRIAAATGGTSREVGDGAAPLAELYEDRVLPAARGAFEREARRRRENRYQWPLGLALVLWVADLWRSERRRR
jgi:Ca-activated chloride channel family protein